MGHATRSKVIIDFLLKEHDVHIVSSASAFHFLNDNFPDKVHEIKGLHFAYKNSRVSKRGTFILNLKRATKNALFNFSSYLLLHEKFRPDLIISDFESFTYFYSKYYNVPIISIDNMQVMNRCLLDIEIPKNEKRNYRLAKAIVKTKLPGCNHYFISSFFDAIVEKERTELVPPIIRNAILNAQVTTGNHILMYQTSSTLLNVRAVLHQFPDIQFYVYGFGKDEQDKNITFKSFSEEGFVKDLANARAVIANGGYSFISEAIYLKKPIYSFPIKGQFEQFMNAAYIDKLGYGKHFEELEAGFLKVFLSNLDAYSQNLSKYKQDGNTLLFEKLHKRIKDLEAASV